MNRATNVFRRRLPYSYFYATLGIIAVNLLVYFLVQVDSLNLRNLVMIPGAVLIEDKWWTLFTYMYTHYDMTHILFNMIGLFFFGMAVEHTMGSWEFLIFYHVVGLLAGAFSFVLYLFTGQIGIALLGASGALFGVMLAFATFRPEARILVLFIIPVKAAYLVIVYTAFELFSQIFNPYSGIAHMTHLAGFLFAFFYLWIRYNLNAVKVFWNLGR